MHSIISSLLIFAGVSVSFYLLAKWFPAKGAHKQRKQITLDKKYTTVSLISLGCLATVMTITWDWLFVWIFRWHLSNLPHSIFIIKPEPDWGMLCLPALGLGVLSAYPCSLQLLKSVFGNQYYVEQEKKAERRSGIDSKKLAIVVYAVSLVLSVPPIPFLMDWYARFSLDEIALNPFLGLGETKYRYEDIVRLVESFYIRSPLGRIRQELHHFVIFRDGRQWCAESYLSSVQRIGDTNKNLMNFLSAKTGKPIEKVKFIEELRK